MVNKYTNTDTKNPNLLEIKRTGFGVYAKVYSDGKKPAIWRFRDGGEIPDIEMSMEEASDMDDFEFKANDIINEFYKYKIKRRNKWMREEMKKYKKDMEEYMMLPYLFRLFIVSPKKPSWDDWHG